MTRFTKYKMLFEAMRKFVTEDPIESAKLTRCIECADEILKRMNLARLRKEQEALLKQIKRHLEIQIPYDENVQHLQVRFDRENSFSIEFLRSFRIV